MPQIPSTSLPLGATGKRILWVISFYRGGCALALLGSALLSAARLADVSPLPVFTVCAWLYFFFTLILVLAAQMERELLPLPWLLLLATLGDTCFLAIMISLGGNALLPLPILIFPQLVAHGWLLDTRSALVHALLPAFSFLGVDTFLYFEHRANISQLIQTAVIGAGYVATAWAATTVGRYTKVSERLMQQRNIDIANLEQINRIVIRDMKDGVLVLDLRGVVRGYNLQALTLLNVADYAAAGQRLVQWNTPLHDAWAFWNEHPGMPLTTPLAPFAVAQSTSALMPRFVRIGSGSSGGTLIYLEDLGRARAEAQNLKLAALGRLTASIAHEVRNPLSAIQQAAQLLEEDAMVPPEGARLLSMIRNNGKRIDRIVTEVLQLNRRDRRNNDILPLKSTLQHMLDEVCAGEQIPEKNLQLHFNAPEDLRIAFDRGHFDQILWNLLRNAWQFCRKQEGSLEVSVSFDAAEDQINLDICDDGQGIPNDKRDQLFEPFYTTRSSGTGLGLYIARELATANQAALDLMPYETGHGAHFRLKLTPLAP